METFYGSEGQQALLRRGRALFTLIEDDTRFTYYGRGVGLCRQARDDDADLLALTQLTGVCHYASVPEAEADAVQARLEGHGLSVTRYARWVGQARGLDAARHVLAERVLPGDLTVHVLGPETPEEIVAKYAEVALRAGVMPGAGSVLRGVTRPGVALVALDGAGAPVSSAAAAATVHRDTPEFGGQCWWGALATDPSRRGEGLSLILGARAMLAMHERHGFADFMTGVQPGNAASEAVCNRMGLAPEPFVVLTAVDAAALPGGKLTR